MNIIDGQLIALLGAGFGFLMAGIDRQRRRPCRAGGCRVLTDDPSKFVSVMIMEALPSTQAIYAFVIAFFIIGNIEPGMTVTQGLHLFAAALPVGVVGFISAIYQGKVSAAGIQMLAKHPDALGSAVTLALMVEMFAILSLIVSILMIG